MNLLIAGAGGHGRVVADAAESSGVYSEIAFLDDRLVNTSVKEGWKVVGVMGELRRLRETYTCFVAAIGDADLRLDWLQVAADSGFELRTVIHRSAIVSTYCDLGPGTVVIAGAVVNVGARLARGCIVNTGATVDHDCTLEEGVHVCPGAHLAGNVNIGARTWIGIGSAVKQGISIGSHVLVGAGAVVTKDVSNGITVVGNPARPLNEKR